MGRLVLGFACLFLVLGLVSCGGDDEGGGATTPAPEAGDSKLATPRGSIEYQLELLMAQKVDELKACFTPRLQDRITAETVAEGVAQAGSMGMDDIYDSAQEGEYEGKKTVKVKMKNGRTLTTLVLTDGKWLADTIWFK